MHKNTEMTNKSMVLHVKPLQKGDPNWIFIPGGPGMGPEYMIDLATKLRLKGSISIFDLPKTPPYKGASKAEIVKSWQEDLIEITSKLEAPILLGHSFGGMFCLGTPELAKTIKGLVISDASPDTACCEPYAEEIKRVGTPEMDILEESFTKNPTEENLRLLFTSWAPFFFLDPNNQSNQNILKNHSYNPLSYQIGVKSFLSTFKNLWSHFPIPTLLLAGEFDRITPLHLFDRVPVFNSVPRVNIKSAGHFPWIENLHGFENALLKFEANMNLPIK